jgi:predicted  nucleic acid-binding Zn ribbon protein
MPDDQKIVDTSPTCPECAATTVLKEALRHLNGIDYFFKCTVCAIIFPIARDTHIE